jgi:Leucine Rich repeat
LFPKLQTLALRNSNFADEIAKHLARSPLLDRIDHLDLSMGTLSDEGASALAASGKLGRLKSLNIEHHYVSDEVRAKLAAATPNLIADEAEVADSWDGKTHYYVSVSE